MTFILPDVPPGVHPWLPAEDDFSAKIAADLSRHLALAERCVITANQMLSRGQSNGVTDVYRVHAILLIRVLHDLRGSVLCALAGYTMQSWTVAASCFEAAHTIGFIGRDVARAKKMARALFCCGGRNKSVCRRREHHQILGY